MENEQCKPYKPRPVLDGFLGILIEDVLSAILRRETEDVQANRRELIRTIFAAVEGAAWTYRTEIVEIAKSIDALTFEEEQAFAEKTFSISTEGRIQVQQRQVPTPALIRLTSRLAMKLNPNLECRFDGLGWEQFRKAAKIRNRITHPKRNTDLVISEADVSTCLAAFYWLLELQASAMEAANSAAREYLEKVRYVVGGLVAKDPNLLAIYNEVAKGLDG